jgi:hypothetical protein
MTAQNLSQNTVVSTMLGAISGSTVAPLPTSLSDNKYIRGKTLFGNVDKYFGQVADSNYMQWFKDPNGYAIGPLDPGTNVPTYTFSPPLPENWTGGPPTKTTTYTLIGTPVQTDCGVEFSVLLDPRLMVVMPPMLVHLDNAIIRQLMRQMPQGPYMPLAQDGTYVVAEVQHHGDTRGDLWQTDVRGYTRAYTQGALRGIFMTGRG